VFLCRNVFVCGPQFCGIWFIVMRFWGKILEITLERQLSQIRHIRCVWEPSELNERPWSIGSPTFTLGCLGSRGHCCGSQLFPVRQRCSRLRSLSGLVSLWMNKLRVRCGGTQTGRTKTPAYFTIAANNEPHSHATI